MQFYRKKTLYDLYSWARNDDNTAKALIEEFNKYISRNSFYSELNYTDIDSELSKLDESILEKKNVLDTFMSSYKALINAGISGAEREEYASYVTDAKLSYYEDIEKMINLYLEDGYLEKIE